MPDALRSRLPIFNPRLSFSVSTLGRALVGSNFTESASAFNTLAKRLSEDTVASSGAPSAELICEGEATFTRSASVSQRGRPTFGAGPMTAIISVGIASATMI